MALVCSVVVTGCVMGGSTAGVAALLGAHHVPGGHPLNLVWEGLMSLTQWVHVLDSYASPLGPPATCSHCPSTSGK